jgi:hypothetical protein
MLKLRTALIGLALLPLSSLAPAADPGPAKNAAAKVDVPVITPLKVDVIPKTTLGGFWATWSTPQGARRTDHPETLTEELKRARDGLVSAGADPKGIEVVINPSKDVKYEDLIAVYQAANAAKIDRIMFATMAAPEDAKNFFNGKDLTGFWGDLSLWHVENGELVGKTETGIKHNEFLKTIHSYGDFRLVCKMKLVPNTANSGIQFHSSEFKGNEMSGPQADAGKGYWGTLYGENFGNKKIGDNKSGEDVVLKSEDWNVYEVVAVGTRVRTAMNGHLCVDVDIPNIPQSGMFGLQIHAGKATEVRFKDFELELNPKFELKTLKE